MIVYLFDCLIVQMRMKWSMFESSVMKPCDDWRVWNRWRHEVSRTVCFDNYGSKSNDDEEEHVKA